MGGRSGTVIAPPAGFRGTFRRDHAARAAYSEGAGPYRILPAAVAVPHDLEDLVCLVGHAKDQGQSLVPRGAGSGMPGGNVGPGIIVDLSRFDHPLTVRHPARATVGAAVTWNALEEAATHRGLRFPPNPSSGAYCTIGGMVATNAAGARSVLAGSVRRWVRSLDLVAGTGEVVSLSRSEGAPLGGEGPTSALSSRFAACVHPEILRAADAIRQRYPRTRKNSAGYALDAYLESGDLVDLVIGSEGTLGFVTRIEVDLQPVPGAVAGLLVGLAELDSLGEVVAALLTLAPAAIEFLDRSFLTLAQATVPFALDDVAAVLLVDFEGPTAPAARETVSSALQLISSRATFAHSALSSEEYADMWALRHAASPVLAALPDETRSLQVIEDGCVPVPKLADYLSEVHRAGRDLGIGIVAFGHAGDGHLHVNALVDTTQPDAPHRIRALFDRVNDIVLSLGGTPSGEHGDGRLRACILGQMYGEEILRLFHVIKQTFDPSGILNPGVILSEGTADPVASLKVGRKRTAIPPRVADALRALERAGDWGTPRLELLNSTNPR